MYVADPQLGYVHAEAHDLDMKLQYGDGINYPGDPRLSLSMGVIKAGLGPKKGKIVARRYEVWRHTEDGEDVLIGHWRLEQFDQILPDIIAMDIKLRGHVPVEEQIDKANAAKEKELDDQLHDTIGEYMEHRSKLIHDTTQPRNTFRGIPGRRDAVKENGDDAEQPAPRMG